MPFPTTLPTMLRKALQLAGAVSLLASILSAATTCGPTKQDDQHWVGTWATALHEPDLGVPGLSNTGFHNQTLRQIIHTSVGGHRVRVRFSTFGAGPLNIGAAHIARSGSGGTIEPPSDRRLTFGGKPSITIPAGAPIVSDPVDLESPALGDLAVSIYLPESTGPASWHFESRQTSYVSIPGNFTASPSMPVDSTPVAWFWLAGVEVMAPAQTGAVVTFGDSTTDGTHSSADSNRRWPDQLASIDGRIAVLNEGMAGNRLLNNSLGPNALARFDRDVLSQSGVQQVIVLIGAGDIINPFEAVTADQIIQGHRQIIERAHAKGLKIYGGTLTPNRGFLFPGTSFPAFSPGNEAKRQAVNAWIRTSGEYDGVIDFDRVLRDPNVPTRIRPSFDSGDHGHPNDEGYRGMAEAVLIN